jgi:methanogenic corrinoid protein MtbC1
LLLKAAVGAGHTISSVADLSDDDLAALVGLGSGNGNGSYSIKPQDDAIVVDHQLHDINSTIELALRHVMQLDQKSLESVLSAAAMELPRQAFIQHVIGPMFSRIGELWRTGQLKIIHEHMASIVVRAMLWDMLRVCNVSNTAPRLLVATPVGHWHEFGALTLALAAYESGWQALYFGPDLPSEEIAYAVTAHDAKVLTMSISHSISNASFAVELKKIRRLIGEDVPIIIGGYAAQSLKRIIHAAGGILIDDLAQFRSKIETLAQRLT